MKKSLFFLSFLLPLAFGFSWPETASLTTCPEPGNVAVVSQTFNSISFNWDDCNCDLTEYKVFYVRGGYTSPEFSTGNSNFSYSNLSAGTYDFYFYSVCDRGESGLIIIEDQILQ